MNALCSYPNIEALRLALEARGATVSDLDVDVSMTDWALTISATVNGQHVSGHVTPPVDPRWDNVAENLIADAARRADADIS